MRVLVAPIQWSDTVGSPWSDAETLAIADTLRAYYAEASYGQLAMNVTTTPFLRSPSQDSRSGSAEHLKTELRDAIKARGLGDVFYAGNPTLSPWDAVVWVTPRSSDVGAKGFNWGPHSWVNCGGSSYEHHAAVHEMGHGLGLSHPNALAGALTASGTTYTFPPLTQSSGPGVQDYYDACTAMGYEATKAHFCAAEKTRLGWITPAVYDGQDRSYQLTPMAQAGGSLYAVKIPMAQFRPGSTRVYWVEYRTPVGFDAIVAAVGGPGIQIRVAGGEFGITTQAWLTDHKVFVPGERFADGTITIDVTGPGQVHIHQSGSFLPPPPPSTYFITDAQLATLISTWRAVTVPTITQQQFDTVQGILNAIAGAAPVPPSSTVRVPPAASLTAPDGAVWTLSGNVVLRNGTNTGGKGSLIALEGSTVKVLGTDGGWWVYINGGWQRTSAPS